MTDTNYSRMPNVDSGEPEEKEEMIFKEPDTIARDPTPKQPENPDDKKKRLSDHLARCREKSKVVRAKKKEERIANKKPRGRPKKKVEVNENANEIKVIDNSEEIDNTKASLEMKVEEVPKKKLEFKPKEEPKKLATGIAQPDEPINKNFNMIDYEKLSNMVAQKMKPVVRNESVQEKKIVNNQEQMGNFLKQYGDAVRVQEQKRIQKEKEDKEKEDFKKRTKRYYGKLPAPDLFSENNWDNIFNPRRI